MLHVELYVNDIKKNFSDTLEEYASCNKRDIWDMCKIRLEEYTIRYCTIKRQHSRDECKEIEDDITKIDKLISKKRKNDRGIISFKISRDLLKCKYDLHTKERASGAQIRSRAKWLEQGEKSTSYLLKLEKVRQSNNSITSLRSLSEEIVASNAAIMKEATCFYRELYT